ncbi:MAG: hypothetical protein ABR521_14670 [Gaiellaceae bacterium]
MSAFASALGRRLRDERGIALIMVVQFMLILGIVGASVTYYSTGNANSSTTALADQKAFGLAETGFSTAFSILSSVEDPALASSLPTSASPGVDATTYPGGKVEWWGSWDSVNATWTIYGRGTVKNPAGKGDRVRVVSQQARVGASGATVGGNPAWGYLFVDNRTGVCVNLQNSVLLAEPMFITGDLCLSNTAQVLPSASPLTVGRRITVSQTAMIGSVAAQLPQLHVGTGCRYNTGNFTFPCTASHRVWATAQDRVVASITKPPIDVPFWYANAKPGPKHACSSGSFPGGFDNDLDQNRSLPDVDPFVTSYDCTVSVGSTVLGRIAYNAGTGEFVIKGVVFFDGNIVVNSDAKVLYSGRGTIYAAGKIDFGNSLNICAKRLAGNCDYGTAAWDPEVKLLAWIAAGTNFTPDLLMRQSVQFQGAAYATTDTTIEQSVKWQGPIITNNLNLQNSSQGKYLPFNTLAEGMPAEQSGNEATLLPGTWSG